MPNSRFAAGVQVVLKKGEVTSLTAELDDDHLCVDCTTTAKQWYLSDMHIWWNLDNFDGSDDGFWFAHGGKSLDKWFGQSYDQHTGVLTLSAPSEKPKATILIDINFFKKLVAERRELVRNSSKRQKF